MQRQFFNRRIKENQWGHAAQRHRGRELLAPCFRQQIRAQRPSAASGTLMGCAPMRSMIGYVAVHELPVPFMHICGGCGVPRCSRGAPAGACCGGFGIPPRRCCLSRSPPPPRTYCVTSLHSQHMSMVNLLAMQLPHLNRATSNDWPR